MVPRSPTIITEQSESAFQKASRVLAGGVSSPARAFTRVGGVPRFIAKGKGAVLTDIDGNSYVDYVGAWGPLVLGHADEQVSAAITKAMSKGWSFGAPNELETQLAERIVRAMPAIERLRFVNSGTEAIISALRLARGFTGREIVACCAGGYHGHSDSVATPLSTAMVSYNSLEAAEQAFRENGGKVAAFIVEPVAGNMGLVPPAAGYLQGLRELCTKHGALLVFDEVLTGFRVAYGGAQELYKVEPDLTCLGKVIGGGLPLGAFGGREDVMARLAPEGPVLQTGALAGNVMAVAAGVATLDALVEQGVYDKLDSLSAQLVDGIAEAAAKVRATVSVARVGSMLSVFLTAGPVTNHESAQQSNLKAYSRFFQAMLDRGIYLPPTQFQCMFVSLAHTPKHIDRTVKAAAEALACVAAQKE